MEKKAQIQKRKIFSKYSQYYYNICQYFHNIIFQICTVLCGIVSKTFITIWSLSTTAGGVLIYFGVGAESWNFEAGFFQVLLW